MHAQTATSNTLRPLRAGGGPHLSLMHTQTHLNKQLHQTHSGHSVLVAAHTSAGKTVVAEYAFGMALRCVYV